MRLMQSASAFRYFTTAACLFYCGMLIVCSRGMIEGSAGSAVAVIADTIRPPSPIVPPSPSNCSLCVFCHRTDDVAGTLPTQIQANRMICGWVSTTPNTMMRDTMTRVRGSMHLPRWCWRTETCTCPPSHHGICHPTPNSNHRMRFSSVLKETM